MKDEKKYEEHVMERWNFAKNIAEKLANKDLQKELSLSIFDKVCSPHHFFIQNDEQGQPSQQTPTEKQIAYAKQLGIQNPEKFSKQQLSEEIDKAKRQKEGLKNGIEKQ